MRVRAYIEAHARRQGGVHMVEEGEWADHAPGGRRQHPPHREAAQVTGAGVQAQLDDR
jgi:hypothetical protein